MPKWKRQPPPLKDELRLAIAKRVASEAHKLGGYTPLARAITDTYLKNLSEPGWRPRGRFITPATKLSKLATYDRSVSMSIVEWEALDVYFNHELTRSALFEFPSLVQDLAQSSETTIFIPSRFSSEDGPMTNYWDDHGVAEIQQAVNQHGPAVKFTQVYVQRRQEKAGTPFGKWKNQFRKRGKKGPAALACMGSPRSNRASELALRLMFRRPKKTRGGWDKLPFSFGFLNHEQDGVASNFSRPLDELTQTHPDLAAYVREGKGWVLIAGEDSFCSEAALQRRAGSGTTRLETRIHSYGVLAAQRQEGQLVVVVAGLTGPGSLVAAAGLDMMTANLPQPGDPFEHAVLWAVVEATVNTRHMWDGGPHQLEDLRFAIPPRLWDPQARRAVSFAATGEAEQAARPEPTPTTKRKTGAKTKAKTKTRPKKTPPSKTNKTTPPKSADMGGEA